MMIFRLLIPAIQFKKLTATQKLKNFGKKTPDHGKCITTSEFNKLAAEKLLKD